MTGVQTCALPIYGGVICVGAPSDAEWEERGGEDVTDDPSRT